MNKYDFAEIDKQMSGRVLEVFGNPNKHKFFSIFDALQHECGPRGGKVMGRKLICFHCGQKNKGHAIKTEQL